MSVTEVAAGETRPTGFAAGVSPVRQLNAAGMTAGTVLGSATGGARLASLDFLRGVAILLVMGAHMPLSSHQAGFLAPLASLWTQTGWIGIDLFFVLSGFLVGGLLFGEIRKRGRIDVGQFLVRRGFKIWPSYFALLSGVWLYSVVVEGQSVRGMTSALLPNLLHLQNYLGSPLPHTWSLAVEEHFYLGLAALLSLLIARFGLRLRGSSMMLTVFGTIALLCLGLRLWAAHQSGSTPASLVFPTHCRVDSLFAGVVIAHFYHFQRESLVRWTRKPGILVLVGTLLIVPSVFVNKLGRLDAMALNLSVLYVGAALVLIGCVATDWHDGSLRRFLNGRIAGTFALVGTFSYNIYLWHLNTGYAGARYLAARGILSGAPPALRWSLIMAGYLGVAFLMGICFTYGIEKPGLALRNRWFPRRA